MPTINVDGVSLYYEEKGVGEPVVFSHGIPTDYRAWGNQMDDFSKNYRAVAYSRRYAAPNKREGDLSDSTIENNAADLKSFIDVLGVAPVHLVGTATAASLPHTSQLSTPIIFAPSYS